MSRDSQAVVCNSLDRLVQQGRRLPCLYVDPPWRYDQSPRGAAENHYPALSLDDLSALPVDRLAAADAHLHLWVTHSFYEAGLTLLRAWGVRVEERTCVG